MVRAYTPRPDSLPARVINFFAHNPDEELDLEAISDKFDVTRGNIHTQLGDAVDTGMLVRSRNADGDYIYTSGKNAPGVHDRGGVNMDAVHKRQTVKPTKAEKPAPPQLDQVVIEDDIPLPGVASRVKQDWLPLIKKLQPKQSFKLPLDCKYMVAKAMTDAHKAELGTYTMRTFPETKELRVWRTA